MMGLRIWSIGVALAAALMGNAVAETLDPAKPEDAVRIAQKMGCKTLKDKQPTYAYVDGGAFARVPGEKDRKLFYVRVLGVTQCKSFMDERRGPGYRSVHREVLFYYDPDTMEMLRTWTNPWTGEEVEVVHVANDPVNMRAPTHAYDEDGNPYTLDIRTMYGVVMKLRDVPLFYKNPLGGEFQDYVGGTYQAMESFQDFFHADELFDSETDIKTHYAGWFRYSKFLPWMKMGDRTGMMFFTAKAGKIFDLDQVPADMIAETEAYYPEFLSPPRVDDDRPNETSWIGFKNYMEAKEEAGQ